MLVEQNHSNSSRPELDFIKMSGAGNDFVICDLRNSDFCFHSSKIVKIANRQNIGCDQFIVMRKSFEADCEMQIFNADGSIAGACGNATRCVAKILIDEKSNNFAKNNGNSVMIKTAAGLLKAWPVGNQIAVNMGKPKIIEPKILLYGFNFCYIDIGNPHAVAVLSKPISDEEFFKFAPKIEIDSQFPNKTNVEFCHFSGDNQIAVRVWERGVGETLACGSGACAVGFYAIQNSLVHGDKALIRFKGGDLIIAMHEEEVVMTGDYQKIFYGKFDENFLV